MVYLCRPSRSPLDTGNPCGGRKEKVFPVKPYLGNVMNVSILLKSIIFFSKATFPYQNVKRADTQGTSCIQKCH